MDSKEATHFYFHNNSYEYPNNAIFAISTDSSIPYNNKARNRNKKKALTHVNMIIIRGSKSIIRCKNQHLRNLYKILRPVVHSCKLFKIFN